MTKLRKCPFCGGEAEIGRIFGHESVYCTKCDACILPSPYDDKDELKKSIEAWNKRVPQTTKDIEEYIEKTHKENMELVAKLKRKYEVES